MNETINCLKIWFSNLWIDMRENLRFGRLDGNYAYHDKIFYLFYSILTVFNFIDYHFDQLQPCMTYWSNFINKNRFWSILDPFS